jgi:hypothetical protein
MTKLSQCPAISHIDFLLIFLNQKSNAMQRIVFESNAQAFF